MRLWHDDIRPAPEGWVWARTNEAAMKLLRLGEVEEISLDHDLGLEHFTEEQINADPELLFGRGQAEETGYDLVDWMVRTENVPAVIAIHSWNPDGASRMAAKFNDHGYNCVVRPFKVKT